MKSEQEIREQINCCKNSLDIERARLSMAASDFDIRSAMMGVFFYEDKINTLTWVLNEQKEVNK